MEMKTKAVIATIVSIIVNIAWILGLIFADVNYFIISMIVLIVAIVFAIKNFNDIKEFFNNFNKKDGAIKEDERTEYVEERASLPAWTSLLAINIYAGIAILTLRNIYPQ